MSMVVNKENAMNNFLDADQVITDQVIKGFKDFLVGGAIGITGGILFIEFCSGMLKLAKKNHIIYDK